MRKEFVGGRDGRRGRRETPWACGGRPGPGSSGVDIDVLRLVELPAF